MSDRTQLAAEAAHRAAMSDRQKASQRVPKALTAESRKDAKTPPVCLGKTASLEEKPPASGKRATLEWQEVNRVTWRLVDPDAPQLFLEASHGQWGGYRYPKALAYVIDVGDSDWRVRVRRRGGWTALGRVIDFQTAKHIAQQAVENPTVPRPCKFDIPLNLVGGERRMSGAPALDSQTARYIQHVEIGAVKVDAPNEQPTVSGDDESINLCANDDWIDWPPEL